MKKVLITFFALLFALNLRVYAYDMPRHAPNMYVDWQSSYRFDAVEVDWCCTQDAENTYWAVHNWNNGYAGFQNRDGEHVLLLSLWDLKDGTVPMVEYSLSDNSGVFGGEGTGKQVFTDYNWEIGKWYTMRIQIDKDGQKTIYSQWIKEENSEWIKTAAISYSECEFAFDGISMFQEDFTFNNRMRSCKLKNANAKIYGTNEWTNLTECKISNSYFPTDESTWENGVIYNVAYDCDWNLKDDYIWIQSGGQDYTSNCKTLPITYNLQNSKNNENNNANNNIDSNFQQTDDGFKKDNAEKNVIQKIFENFLNWIKDLFGNDDIDEVVDEPPVYEYQSSDNYSESELISINLSDFIGQTVYDVKKEYGNNFSFDGYEGTTVIWYYDLGISFYLEKYSNSPSDQDKIIAVSSNKNIEVFDKMCGNITFEELKDIVGSEEELEYPDYYHNLVDDIWEYSLQFEYNGYNVNYVWYEQPDCNKSIYVYVRKK